MKKVLFPILSLVLALGLSLPMAAGASPGPGLVGLWHLDEGSGQTAADATGVNDGQLGSTSGVDANDPTWEISGKFGNALSFDGVDDYVLVNDDDSLSPGSAVTLEAWIKPASIPTYMMVAGKWNDGPTEADYAEYEIQIWNGKVRFFAYGADTGYKWAESSMTLVAGNWYHVAGVFDGSTLQVYVNGSPDGSSVSFAPAAGIPNTAARFTIGAQYWYGSWWRHFNGTIDEVRIWDEALSAGDIESSFNLSKLDFTKELVSAVNMTGDPVNTEAIPLGKNVTFTMNITVDNSATGLNLTAVMVKDRLGAELKLISPDPENGSDDVESWTRGKSKKWFIDWTIGSLGSGESQALIIVAHTDYNPGGGKKAPHQEYTSEDTYELNSGATLTFTVIIADEDIQLVLTTDPISVTVVGEEGD